jgi:hypothetical protein
MTTDQTPISSAAEVSIAIVIPTRNRASLAINAIRALVDQPGCRLQVFVSDNSSSPDEIRQLSKFCSSRANSRITYLRPPQELAMATHWDWAMQQALSLSDADYFTIHYDRMLMKPRELTLLGEVAARFPNLLITYARDQTLDLTLPVMVCQTPWTGKVYEVQTSRVITLARRGLITEIGHPIPVLSNCLVPRSMLENIRQRFGSICDSTGPDSCFMARFCALYDTSLHFDRPLGILYASHRSNGWGYMKGRTDGDFADFLAASGNQHWLEASPIPGVSLGQNMLYHEYELVRRATGTRLPPLDVEACLGELGRSLKWIDDPKTKTYYHALLKEHGWEDEQTSSQIPAEVPEPAELQRSNVPPPSGPTNPLKFIVNKLRQTVARGLYSQRATLFRADYLGLKPPHICGFTFRNNRKAIQYALTYPRYPDEDNPFIAAVEPVEIWAGPAVSK